jgi:hypothetical protein
METKKTTIGQLATTKLNSNVALKKSKIKSKFLNSKTMETTETKKEIVKDKTISEKQKENVLNVIKTIGEKEIINQKSIYNYTREEEKEILTKDGQKKLRNKLRNKFNKLIDTIYLKNKKGETITKADFKMFVDYSEFRYKNFDANKRLFIDTFIADNTKEETKQTIQSVLDLFNKVFNLNK